MHIKCKEIEDGFIECLSGKQASGLQKISSSLSKQLNKKISVVCRGYNKAAPTDGIFIMSISPERSTTDKITSAIMNEETKFATIQSLWEKCNNWTLTIDNHIFDILNADELTALTMHECGHMIYGDTVPKRLADVVQFSIMTGNTLNKAILSDNFFLKLAKIPVMSAANFHMNRSAFANEIRADKMATSNGYLSELVSAMDKITNYLSDHKIDMSDEAGASVNYINDIISSLNKRKLALTKKQIFDMKRASNNDLMTEAVDQLCNIWDLDNPVKADIVMRHFEYVEKNYYEEFGFGKNRLDPIKREQLDYIMMKIEAMTTMTDKMMIVSYINGKIELCDYYKEILRSPKASKKYKVPHTMSELESIWKTLMSLRKSALDKKIGPREVKIEVSYPVGYEG